jgi:PadR family transcriptional regulator PadR
MSTAKRKPRQIGMKVGAISLWLLILLSERPMYGYEIIKELEKRFSGYWKPKTGAIYPALEKLEQDNLVTSQREFREEGPDRKHYAIAKKGESELSQSVLRWIKMMEMLEQYRETHEAMFRYKDDNASIDKLSDFLINIGKSLKDNKSVEISKFLPSIKDKATTTTITKADANATTATTTIKPIDPIAFKFLYAKENDKFEIHMEVEWMPK